jgi:hypothetical protein
MSARPRIMTNLRARIVRLAEQLKDDDRQGQAQHDGLIPSGKRYPGIETDDTGACSDLRHAQCYRVTSDVTQLRRLYLYPDQKQQENDVNFREFEQHTD